MQKYFYKKSLAEIFLKKKFSGNISLIAPVVDTLAGLCQPCVQIHRTQFPSFNINPLFSIIITIIIGHSFLFSISAHFSFHQFHHHYHLSSYRTQFPSSNALTINIIIIIFIIILSSSSRRFFSVKLDEVLCARQDTAK